MKNKSNKLNSSLIRKETNNHEHIEICSSKNRRSESNIFNKKLLSTSKLKTDVSLKSSDEIKNITNTKSTHHNQSRLIESASYKKHLNRIQQGIYDDPV